jgi:hypothetical protein
MKSLFNEWSGWEAEWITKNGVFGRLGRAFHTKRLDYENVADTPPSAIHHDPRSCRWHFGNTTLQRSSMRKMLWIDIVFYYACPSLDCLMSAAICLPVGDKWLIISWRWCSLFQRTRLSQQDTNYTHVIQSTICVSPSARFAACSLKGKVRVAKACAVGTDEWQLPGTSRIVDMIRRIRKKTNTAVGRYSPSAFPMLSGEVCIWILHPRLPICYSICKSPWRQHQILVPALWCRELGVYCGHVPTVASW